MTAHQPNPTGSGSYAKAIADAKAFIDQQGKTWSGIDAESVARMRLQNKLKTGLDIAKYTAAIMRADMAAYDADPANYTQSLGCWHGFIGQQKMISIKKHFGTTKGTYLYLSGWMVAALRSEFGPLPDQSMHEKTSVPALIGELYTFLRQADARELGGLYRDLDSARAAGNAAKAAEITAAIETHQTHVVPIIADIDAGFGNAEATYLLAKKMIEAGACALQIENQVSDEKQCGHQDGKVTVPHEVFLAKVRACRYAFMELGVEDGIVVTRTDSLGAGLTQQLAYSNEPGDLGDQYNSFLDCEEVTADDLKPSDVVIKRDGKDEYVEGEGERIEHDAKTEITKFFNRAYVKSGLDEVRGQYIVFDGPNENYSVTSGPAGTALPGRDNRVRAVIQPKNKPEAEAASTGQPVRLQIAPSMSNPK